MHDEHPEPKDPAPPSLEPGESEFPQGASGLVVLCDGLDDDLLPVRSKFDEGFLHDVPSHVTLLFPWVPREALTLPDVHRVRELLASHDAFEAQLTSIGRFGDQVVFLNPEPRKAWLSLTNVLTSAYPQYPPYDGAYETVIPHVTVAHNRDFTGLTQELTVLEDKLPLSFLVSEVTLLRGIEGAATWNAATRFPLRTTT